MACTCGAALIIPSNNIKSGNTTQCKLCANIATGEMLKAKACEEFSTKATELHGDNFCYMNVEYADSCSKVSIKCNTCDLVFEQSPHSHLQGRGCPNCSTNGFNKNKPAILYYFKIKDVWKIGVTSNMLERRYNKADRANMTNISTWYFELGADAYDYEQNILKLYKDFKSTGPTPFTDGTGITECFCTDIYSQSML